MERKEETESITRTTSNSLRSSVSALPAALLVRAGRSHRESSQPTTYKYVVGEGIQGEPPTQACKKN